MRYTILSLLFAASLASAGETFQAAKPPDDCPFLKSKLCDGIVFTGRHKTYTTADTWYPSWASDGNLYSPWTDGKVGSVGSFSGPKRWTTGQAKIEGDDPLNLKITSLGLHKGPAAPYGGRYPCGSLVHEGVWYYGTYCLDKKKYPWDIMGPFVGFRISKDFGKTWTDTPCTPAKPLFGESGKAGSKIKMGSPHFVDFGKNMRHAPDGKAYLTGHGAARKNATCSWVSGDQIYLARVAPTVDNINNVAKYEFFSGHDAQGKAIWTKEFARIKPLLEWNDRLGCVTVTYNAPLKRYLMCVTDGGASGLGTYNTMILEASRITGPWKLAVFMPKFGQQAYFVNIPSKFIGPDGRTMWLCFSDDWVRKHPSSPAGTKYAMCLYEVRLPAPGSKTPAVKTDESPPPADAVVIAYRKGLPQSEFAVGRIVKALERSGKKSVTVDLTKSPKAPDVAILIGADDSKLAKGLLGKLSADTAIKPQGFRIARGSGNTLCILASDASGAMYGGLDLAEQITFRTPLAKISEKVSAPAISRRGIKFNIPLDARTPSYDDTGDAAQKNIAEMWSFDFWQEFLDELALHRYNTLTLWNPHPFPSLVRCPDYPDVALADVCVPAIKPEYKSRSWREPQYVSPKVLENLKIVRKMTIAQKIAFWRRVFKHAADRGIDVYWITWNVMVNSAEGKYGLTTAQDNPKTIAYIRQCVRQTILTYPKLKGIGVTAGEGMRNRKDKYDREKWLWQAYGMGVIDAKKAQPDRHVRFIHRVWNSGMDRIMADFAANYPDSFEVGFKYARARLYSSTKPPFVKDLLTEMKTHKVKGWWNLRNDDIFNFRWGDPDYVREFLQNLPSADLTAGYHMGSDGYVWGREHTSTEPDNPRRLEIRKHWYNFMLWGRLGYDPKLDRAFFEKVLSSRLPQAPPATLYNAWQAASKIIPQVNRFHWRNWDFMWAVEICTDQRKGFHTVEDFITCPTMQDAGLVSIRDYVEQTAKAQTVKGISPLVVADRLYGHAGAAAKAIAAIRDKTSKPGKELRRTLSDIEAMSLLGRYYASKIRGAVALQRFRVEKDADQQKVAVKQLTIAAAHWKRYSRIASSLYNPQLLARTRRTDWTAIQKDVDKDIDIAGKKSQ